MPADTDHHVAPAGWFPTRSWAVRWRRMLHRQFDPWLALRARQRAARALRQLPDGDYLNVTPPYIAQFATPSRINEYIHNHLHGRDDPNWPSFGASDPDEYTFWAHRACAIACVKMAADAFATAPLSSMWEWIQAGRDLGGYITYTPDGRFVDQGWLYAPLAALANERGLVVEGMAYASLLNVCAAIRQGWLVAVAVTPEIGEPSFRQGRLPRRYDGHFILAYGFSWKQGRLAALHFHNPSGRSTDLQAHVVMPTRLLQRAFAHRYIAFRPQVAASATAHPPDQDPSATHQ